MKKQQQQNKQIYGHYNRQFMQKGLNMTLDFVEQTLKGNNKVIEIRDPDIVKKQIDFTITQQPCGQDRLLQITKNILQKQTKPYHPHFHNTLFGGFDQFSVLGAMMAPAINGSVYTYQLAPCFTLMEYQVYELFRKQLNWQHIDGIFTPGGSFANFMAITTSRYNLKPSSKKQGIVQPMKIFTSQTSHYSMKKGANLCGIGQDNVIYVKADNCGRMIPDQLDKAICKQSKANNICMLVNATFGTTVQGSIDPIIQIGQLCKKHKIWLHVDAALGGALIFSPKWMQKRKDMFQNVDSITIDPHKGLVVPLQVSLFLTNRKQILMQANSAKADYLFHNQRASYSNDLDIGNKSFQCGRVIDILKFWTYLKGNGLKVIAEHVQNQRKLALYIKQYVIQRPKQWVLAIQEVQTFNICLWYVPKSLNKNDFLNQDHFFALLSQITVLAKKYMIEEGKMLIGYSRSQGKHYFWRPIMSNPFIDQKCVDYQMQLIARYCQMAFEQISKIQENQIDKN